MNDQHEYFEGVEQEMDCKIDAGQRAWYVATMAADFSGAEEKMWQEYPSTPDEAFQVSTKGNYYAKDLVKLRKRGGITSVPVLDLPVYTFWDIGNKDGCAVWFMQELRGEARFINYYEEHLEDLRHYVAHLQDLGYLYGAHFLPHDADHKRLGDFNKSTKQQGLSPLARGNRKRWSRSVSLRGPIPARAGQPSRGWCSWRARRAYPRSRGATSGESDFMLPPWGLSPLARGNLSHLTCCRAREILKMDAKF